MHITDEFMESMNHLLRMLMHVTNIIHIVHKFVVSFVHINIHSFKGPNSLDSILARADFNNVCVCAYLRCAIDPATRLARNSACAGPHTFYGVHKNRGPAGYLTGSLFEEFLYDYCMVPVSFTFILVRFLYDSCMCPVGIL